MKYIANNGFQTSNMKCSDQLTIEFLVELESNLKLVELDLFIISSII
jgi:hypothetical protein